jgi:hypothetical protein
MIFDWQTIGLVMSVLACGFVFGYVCGRTAAFREMLICMNRDQENET